MKWTCKSVISGDSFAKLSFWGPTVHFPTFSKLTLSFSHILRPSETTVCLRFYAEITSESFANGFALEIAPSKRASGKTIRRFSTFVSSSRATRLQRSTVLSDVCAFNRSTSSPSNPTQIRMMPASSSSKKFHLHNTGFPSMAKIEITNISIAPEMRSQMVTSHPKISMMEFCVCH